MEGVKVYSKQTLRDGDRKSFEFLGHSLDRFRKDRDSGKWDDINIYHQTQESFCSATSSLLNNLKDDCKFVIANEEGERYFVNVLDYRFDASENKIIVFPENCRKIKK